MRFVLGLFLANAILQPVRLPQNPIITPQLSASLGDNFNGPSLIRVP